MHDAITRKGDESVAVEGRGPSHVMDRVFEGDLTASAVEHLAAAAGAAPAAPVDVDTEPPRREAGLLGERATEPRPDAGSAIGATLDWAVALGIALVAIIVVALLPESGCAGGHVVPERPRTTVSAH